MLMRLRVMGHRELRHDVKKKFLATSTPKFSGYVGSVSGGGW